MSTLRAQLKRADRLLGTGLDSTTPRDADPYDDEDNTFFGREGRRLKTTEQRDRTLRRIAELMETERRIYEQKP